MTAPGRPAFRIRWSPGLRAWTWECTLCWPPARGARSGPGAWGKVVRISLRGHMRRRSVHHQRAARALRGGP
jgi:hypothetical protein